MAARFPVASRIRVQTKKKDPFATCSSKAEHDRREGRSGAEIGGSGVRQRASSVSGALGARGAASDDDHEVIIIIDNEDSSGKAISVSESIEEEEEPCDYGPQTVRRFEPSRFSRKGKNIVVLDDDAGGDSDKEESEDFLSDDDLIGCDEGRGFGEQGEGNGGSFGSEDDDYVQNVSQKNTPLVTEDSEVDLSSDYLSSSTESSSEADDSSDEDFVAYMSESSSTEEYVSGREENWCLAATAAGEEVGTGRWRSFAACRNMVAGGRSSLGSRRVGEAKAQRKKEEGVI